MKVVRLLATHSGCPYPPGDIPDTHFYYRLRIKSMKNPNDPIGNQTHDLPAYSAAPEPCHHIPVFSLVIINYNIKHTSEFFFCFCIS
jgi:hypothetical protein